MRDGISRTLLRAGLLVAALVLLATLLSVGYVVVRFRDAADYPGATRIAGNNLYRFWPHLSVRRDTTYRTSDPFPAVYNWYSSGFKLGPEAYALSNCIQMARSFTDFYVIERQMSVMVCDTPGARMMFVMRTLSLRLPL